jgi:hypothetical protein
MPHPSDTTPTILLIAEDLLTTLLHDHLVAQGYAVSILAPAWMHQAPTRPWAIDLILAEVRYPYEACVATIAAVRSMANQADIPLVLIGHIPGALQQRLPGRVTWLEGGVPLDVILTAVGRWTIQQPSGPAEAMGMRRAVDVGERRR